MIHVDIFERSATIVLENGRTKTINIDELLLLLNKHSELMGGTQREFSSIPTVLPTGCVSINISPTRCDLIIYRPENIRTVRFTTDKQRTPLPYKIPFPNTVIFINLVSTDGKVYEASPGRVVYRCTPLSSAEFVSKNIVNTSTIRDNTDSASGVYYMPFPNMHEQGTMCFGANAGPSSVNITDLRRLDMFYSILADSPFNTDLGLRGVNRDNFTTLENYFEKLTEFQSFPYDWLSA